MAYDRKRFESVYPALARDILSHTKTYGTPDKQMDRLELHNTVGGEYIGGMMVINTYAHALGRGLSESEYHQAAKLGWVFEFIYASQIVSEDTKKGNEYRNGNPTWHKMPGIALLSINDSSMLKCTGFLLLKKHFQNNPHYVELVDLLHESSAQAEMGRMLDWTIARREKGDDFNIFTSTNCETIATCMTADFVVRLPILLGLYLADAMTPANLSQTQKVTTPLGQYYHFQNEFLCSSESERSVKQVDWYIKEGRCTWTITQALQCANPCQKETLKDGYGCDNPAKVKNVREIFAELQVHRIFHEYASDLLEKIRKEMAGVDESEGLKRAVFEDLMEVMAKGR
ncbi:Farnesyl pyrophosphate synthetase [Aspergillus wentii]|nr:Farnesyl pyrophosphate synthetase [Aspergillus wentii]